MRIGPRSEQRHKKACQVMQLTTLPIGKSLSLLDLRTRRMLPLLMASFAVVAMLDALGIALFFPLVVSLVDDNGAIPLPILGEFLAHSFVRFGASPALFLSALIAVVFVIKNLLSVVLLKWQYDMLFFAEAELGRGLFNKYLREPWPEISNRNSSELIRNASTSCSHVFLSFFVPLITISAELLLLAILLAALLFFYVNLSIAATIIIFALSIVYYMLIKRRLNLVGEQFQRASFDVLNELKQGIGAGREVRVLGRQDELVRRLGTARRTYAKAQSARSLFTQLPRYYLETALVLIFFAVMSVMTTNQQMSEIVPLLTVFGVASLRLMNSASKMLGAAQQLRMGAPAVLAIWGEFHNETSSLAPATRGPFELGSLEEERGLVLERISLAYPGGSQILRDLDLAVNWGECVGIIGPSGSGKSTLFDVMIGLMPPTSGSVRSDGREISTQLDVWLARIGYVPQAVYLSDETLRQNVAFGIPENDIEDGRIERALKLARLDKFVASLPLGADTKVGEQGAAISGGQRQRIGIARALYHDPDVLFLDEATSSLDGDTERLVVESIEALKGKKTIVVIAHRMSTLSPCDRVLTMSEGRLQESPQ